MGDVLNSWPESMSQLYEGLCSAYGRDQLIAYANADADDSLRDPQRQLLHHVEICPDLEVMDYIDAVFQVSASMIETQGGADPVEEPRQLGSELNKMFSEEGVGYQWLQGSLVRFDDEVTHAEAMVPALAVLATGRFGAAAAEFDEAVADFGRGAYRSTLTNANAAFESVLKVLTGEPHLQAGGLIRKAREQGHIPRPLGASVESLEKLMHGIPAIRGQEGSSHGLGEREGLADERLARLVLTMTAAIITFLAGGDADLDR